MQDNPQTTYTLEDVGRMRLAVQKMYFSKVPRPIDEVKDTEKRAEEHLRTYILAGVRPEELERKADENGI